MSADLVSRAPTSTEPEQHAATSDGLEPDLNPQQRAAVEHRGSPLLIVAGAGTGKTRTIVARVVRLIDEGVDPGRILLLTFTRRAASEMIGRVAATAPDRSVDRIWGGTFHAAANRLLRHYGSAAGLPEGFTVLDHGDSTDLFAMVRADEGFGQRGRRFPRAETIASIYSRMVNGQARLGDVLDVDFPWCAEHADDLRTLFGAYTEHKRRHHVLDYDDLLLFWRALTGSTVGEALRCLFDHILIDEYQDTNPIQADIVGQMCGPTTELCVVGDDAQSIYGFRSATVANMWRFPSDHPGATVITLEQNYRSTPPILELANGVLDQHTGPEAGGDVIPAEFRRTLWTTSTGGPRPMLLSCADDGDQARVVADRILDGRERGIDLRDQAVLFRAGHHADRLELELVRRDVPYVKYGGLRYLEAAHVKDLLALLRIMENPADRLAWYRVLKTLDGVGPATAARLTDELRVDKPTANALSRFLDGIGRVPTSAVDQARELRDALADCVSDELDPAAQIERLHPFCSLVFPNRYENARARLADIDQLATSARGYPSRSRFLTELTLDPPGKTGDVADAPHLDDDWLTLSTIHSAKGCEWRAVHLIHAADGNLPSEMALGNEDGLAEELRLLYVAVTRARTELTVSFPQRFHVNRFAKDDRHVTAQLSRFVEPVRHAFDEATTVVPAEADPPPVDLTAVGVAAEVDHLLLSLWDRADDRPTSERPSSERKR